MGAKIFITGGTGYIGGTVLDTIIKQHPEHDVTALLRNVPDAFVQTYPKVNILRGDYDSAETIKKAAANADVVVHNGNSDHEPSIKAIIAGILQADKPVYLIHLSGTGILADWRDPTYLGKLNPKVWSDIDDIAEITSRPDGELHRNVDKIIQAAAREHGDKVKTAIVCPPDIYGPGRGLGRKHSAYVPCFLHAIKSIGAPFYVGEGTNTRSWVHIEDLMKVYCGLVEAAVAGGGGVDWGMEGYYFAGSQQHSQIEIANKTLQIFERRGLTTNKEPVAISVDEAAASMRTEQYPQLGTYLFAANSRTKAERSVQKLGYRPTEPDLLDCLEADIDAVMADYQ